MSERTYNQEQAFAIKRTIIDAWVSDFPSTPPTPESPRRGRRKRGRKLQDMTEEEDAEPLRRSKISQPQSQPRNNAQRVAASNYQQRLGSISLTAETTLNASAHQSAETRSSSPTRTRKNLENAVPKIICRGFSDGVATANLREDVRSLRKELMAAARHHGIFPVSIRDTLYAHLNEWDQDDAYFDDFPRSEKDEDVIWAAVQDLYVKAQRCGELEKPESSWSHEVIRPLIEHALKYTPWQSIPPADTGTP
jgi:hypothetical protein